MKVKFKDKDIEVLLPNKDSLVSDIKEDYEYKMEDFGKDDFSYVHLYEQDVLKDISLADKELQDNLDKIDKIYSNEDNVVGELFNELSTKKNGYFKKNSAKVVLGNFTLTNFFTDYTNAWSTMCLRMRSLGEDTVEFYWSSKTFTH